MDPKEKAETMKDTQEKTKPVSPPQFIPKLVGEKAIIRLVSGGQPMAGTITAYNPYEILVQTAKGQVVVFKSAIATIETVSEPKR